MFLFPRVRRGGAARAGRVAQLGGAIVHLSWPQSTHSSPPILYYSTQLTLSAPLRSAPSSVMVLLSSLFPLLLLLVALSNVAGQVQYTSESVAGTSGTCASTVPNVTGAVALSTALKLPQEFSYPWEQAVITRSQTLVLSANGTI